jgi:hypothetical protein
MKQIKCDFDVARAIVRAYRAGEETVSPDEARFAAKTIGETLRKIETARRLRGSAPRRRAR